MNQINEVDIAGVIEAIEEAYTHHNQKTSKDETFYTITLAVPRFSENYDWVPIVTTEKLLRNAKIKVGDKVGVLGSARSRNSGNEQVHHVDVYVYADDFVILSDKEYDDISNKNLVRIEGVVCKQPNMRTVASGRVITDLLIANNRQCHRYFGNKSKIIRKSSYLPCITWSATAKAASHLRVGQTISIEGRFQSRKFYRHGDVLDEHTAYEISVLDYELSDNKEEIDSTKENAEVI